MRATPEKPAHPNPSDELDLDLPEMDGGEDENNPHTASSTHDEALEEADTEGHSFLDDSTGEDAPAVLDDDGHHQTAADAAEKNGWLADSETNNALDVGTFDVSFAPEGKVLVDDEADTSGSPDDLVNAGDEGYVSDSGEEGPTDDDEELREEDLPALDADEDGDVRDEDLFERGMLGTDEDLRWDDRAWARETDVRLGADDKPEDDSGVLAVPGDDATQSTRDAAWKELDESGRVMAAAFVPGGSVAVALASSDRSRAYIVRIKPDGEARIIAEIKSGTSGGAADVDAVDDGTICLVTFLRWDATRGCLFVGGNFGVEAYRPALQ